jgi:glucosamine--fructose-6-phosphate aminotransferase (isomerizing)
MLRWENMVAGINAQGSWLRDGPAEALAATRAAVDGPPPSRIYLAGCGDSHYCGLAARLAFESWSGIPTEPLPALSFARYVVESAPDDAWAVCVSNSGRVKRTVEAAQKARERGLRTIGITYAPDSPLAETTATTIPFAYPNPGFGPGTISYVASLTVLYAVALRAAELAGTLSPNEADGRAAEVAAQHEAVAETIKLAAAAAEELGRETPTDVPITFLGGGPSFGTASFGAAKIIEAARVGAGVQELEEWAHEEFFCTGPGTLTIVVTPPGAGSDRAVEQLSAVRQVGGTAVAVCSPADPAAAAADAVLPVAGDAPEALSPLSYCVPLELFALHFASSKGLTMFGFDDERRRQLNHSQIFIPD